MGVVQSLAHLARASPMRRTQAGLRGLRTRRALSVRWQSLNSRVVKKTPWLFLESGKGEAAFNMAMDEALLEALPRLRAPVFRSYGWSQPAATFGYFQKFSEVECATMLRPLIRRPTGGGLVPHDNDWTYSVAFPNGHDWFSLPAVESYRRVHEWIQSAFDLLSVQTELAPCCKKNSGRRWTSRTVFRRLRKIRSALVRKKNRRCGTTQKQARPAHPRIRPTAAGCRARRLAGKNAAIRKQTFLNRLEAL